MADCVKMEWRDFRTAPKNGTPILASSDPREWPCIIHWGHVGRYTTSPYMWIGHEYGPMGDGDFTHWMPLPDSPKREVPAPASTDLEHRE